jgi:hypothetical protein
VLGLNAGISQKGYLFGLSLHYRPVVQGYIYLHLTPIPTLSFTVLCWMLGLGGCRQASRCAPTPA